MVLRVENAVINNVLCFLSTSRNVMTEQSIVASCLTFYNGDTILQAKEILFNCLSETIPRRRGDNKSKSDVTDILSTMKECDDGDKALPKFLCDGFSKMPPGSGFENIAEHMMSMITEFSALKNEIKSLQNQVKHLKNSTNSSTISVSAKNSASHKKPITVSHDVTSVNNNKCTTNKKVEQSPQIPATELDRSSKPPPALNGTAAESVPQIDINDDQNTKNENQQWTKVNYRKKHKSALKGSKLVSGLFNGVQDSKDLYVGRCNPLAKDEDITKYIQEELKVKVLACNVISKTESPAKAFKVTLNSEDIEQLLEASIWPKGIRVRKYFSESNERKPNIH